MTKHLSKQCGKQDTTLSESRRDIPSHTRSSRNEFSSTLHNLYIVHSTTHSSEEIGAQ